MITDQNIAQKFWLAHPEALFDVQEIMALLGYSRYWFWKTRQKGTGIKCIKLPRKIVYKKKDVIEWLESQPEA